MARKTKGKNVRKAKGLKHSKRQKATQKAQVAKKSKPSNRKRAESRVGKARASHANTLLPGSEVETDLGVADPVLAHQLPEPVDEVIDTEPGGVDKV